MADAKAQHVLAVLDGRKIGILYRCGANDLWTHACKTKTSCCTYQLVEKILYIDLHSCLAAPLWTQGNAAS